MSLLLRHHRPLFHRNPLLVPQIRSLPTLPSKAPSNPDPRSNLSARLSFVFDQIDTIENRTSEKFDALQRIRQWRESRNRTDESNQVSRGLDAEKAAEEEDKGFFEKKCVELVHPWPEWIELMERLGQQNYFDFVRRSSEDRIAESVGIDLSRVEEEIGFDFLRDWTTVRNACVNFGKDRFDIFRSLSKKDLQILVGHGCPSMDPKVIFSAKLLRKYTHLDEGDVCSSCSLRNSCSRGYILTLKEDEARTIDVMRVLLTYGFDHVNGAVENKPLMQMKSVKTVVRKLLHEIVKLSAVPIDPNLPPPVIKKPPPKVKQPPPAPKKRVGRDDVEMKKGDWLCPKCDFMNFAKNTVCLQCDAKRPKRQLLPGEWECPQCNFLNYRRNMACFHCDAKRPPDEFTENQFQPKQPGLGMRSAVKGPTRAQDISNAWNFDFDDNESDGADVAAFEFADSTKLGNGTNPDSEIFVDEMRSTSTNSRSRERGRYFSDDNERKSNSHSGRTGFDDFDDEEDDDVDSYEIDGSNNNQASDITTRNFSEIEKSSGSEDFDDRGANNYLSDSEEDDLADHPQLKSSHVAESWNKSKSRGRNAPVSDDDGIELDSDFDDDTDSGFGSKQRKSRKERLSKKDSSKRGRGSDSDDDLLLDMDSDGDDGVSYSRSSSMRGSNFRKSNDMGNVRRVIGSDSRENNRRNSFDGHDDDRRGVNSKKSSGYGNSRRGDFSNQRNSFGDENDKFSSRGRRENNRFERFDRENGDRSRGSRRDERSLVGNERSLRGGDRFRRERNNTSSNFSDQSRSFGDGLNRFGDTSRGSRRDERSPRGNERNNTSSNFRDQSRSFGDGSNQFGDGSRGSRRDERSPRRNERNNNGSNFRDRSRSFGGDNNNDRPRRRVIER